MLNGFNINHGGIQEGFSSNGNYNKAFNGSVLDKESFTVDQLDDLNAQLNNDIPADEDARVSMPPSVNINMVDDVTMEGEEMDMNQDAMDEKQVMGEEIGLNDVDTDRMAEDAMIKQMMVEDDSDNDGDEANKEGFNGSSMNESAYLASMLKAILMGLLFYVLSNAKTYNIMKSFNVMVARNLGLAKEIVHTILFILITWIIYMC